MKRLLRHGGMRLLGAACVLFCLSGCGRNTPEIEAPRATPVTRGRAGGNDIPTEGFQKALPGRPYAFPRDHAAHPEYATEWWYYTGSLQDGEGRNYGYQLTFFRVGLAPPSAKRTSAWAASNLYFAHLAVTDDSGNSHRFSDRVARGSFGSGGAATDAYRVHVQDWTVGLDADTHVLRAAQGNWGLALRATPAKMPVIHGVDGVSQKAAGAGRASYYYSYTRMRTKGTLTLNGRERAVAGDSWFDHEFGSNVLASHQIGWDWFSVQLDNNTEIMLYLMRTTGGGTDPYSSGTYVNTRGQATHLKREDYTIQTLDTWKSSDTGAVYPSRWRIRVPSIELDATLEPTVKAQEMQTEAMGIIYWEGHVALSGSMKGRPVSGKGYVELTGYTEALRDAF